MILDPVSGTGTRVRKCARRFHAATALVLAFFIIFGSQSMAQEEPLPSYQVKAAFLYNFTKFIQWPARKYNGPSEPLIIGVIGHDPFGSYLSELQDRKIGEHPIVVLKINSAKEARACHVLVIGQDRKRATQTVSELGNAEVLTITDEVEEDSFKSIGAVINLVTTANKTVHFEINVDAARRAELKINSSLLNLAKIVRDGKA